MWLKLNSDSMKIELEIERYESFTNENIDCQWCGVSFSFSFPECINYARQDSEILLYYEIEVLESKLDDFINNRINEKEVLEFIEPDFEFVFNPNCNGEKSGESILSKFKGSASTVEWKVRLWNGSLTGNYFSTTLNIDECIIFRDYIRLITGKLNINSDEVQKYIRKGFIYG